MKFDRDLIVMVACGAILAGMFGGMHGFWLGSFYAGLLAAWVLVGEKYVRKLRRRRKG